MLVLDPRHGRSDGKRTLADSVFEWLIEQIVTGNVRPGQWISEYEVAALLGMSRTPVRDAFRTFARDGLIEPKHRRGTIIADLDAARVVDIYETRALNDSEMVRRAVERMTDEDVEQVAQVAEETRGAQGDPVAFFDCTVRMWQVMMDACPNRTLCDMVATLWRRRSLPYRGVWIALPGSQPRVVAFFERLAELAQARDAEGAREETAEMQSVTGRMFLEHLFIDAGDNERFPRRSTSARLT